MDYWVHLEILGGYLLTLGLLPVVLLTKKKEPVSTIAWILCIVVLPYAGALLFLIFGINRVQRRLRVRRRTTNVIAGALPRLNEQHHAAAVQLSDLQKTMAHVCKRLGGTRATNGNSLKILSNGNEAFAEIELAIADAKTSIHLEYYIWQPDRAGTRLRDLLIAKAEEGVEVRFLYDGLGSMRLSRRFLTAMEGAGIAIAPFVPGESLRERWSFNLRSHRKIVVCDGEIGFTGGMNIGDEYLGRDPFFGYWRDTHLRMTGPTVRQLQEIFCLDWWYATGEDLRDDRYFPTPHRDGEIEAQILAGGPDLPVAVFHDLFFAAIGEARRNVNLTTSYFVPPPALVAALEVAAQRGVRTRVMLSGPKTYWHTRHAARSYYDSLLAAGVEIHEYVRGQMHSKVLTVDGDWTFVGTPNFDARSLFLNFEVGVAIYDSGLARQLDDLFAADLPDCHQVDRDAWQSRPVIERLKENYCRLFSPVL